MGLYDTSRECPMCGEERVCSVREAEMVFQTADWGATSMLEDADRVCEYCHSVRLEETGEWKRMQTVSSRAWKLAQASSSKNVGEYEDILTAGPGTPDDSPDAPASDGERETVDGAEW